MLCYAMLCYAILHYNDINSAKVVVEIRCSRLQTSGTLNRHRLRKPGDDTTYIRQAERLYSILY